jgi:hypothetical protein
MGTLDLCRDSGHPVRMGTRLTRAINLAATIDGETSSEIAEAT